MGHDDTGKHANHSPNGRLNEAHGATPTAERAENVTSVRVQSQSHCTIRVALATERSWLWLDFVFGGSRVKINGSEVWVEGPESIRMHRR